MAVSSWLNGQIAKPQGFAPLALSLFLVAALGLSMMEPRAHRARSAAEVKAVAVARNYVSNSAVVGSKSAYFGDADARVASVVERMGVWVISFPPECSLTGAAGPRITVSKSTFSVTDASAAHAVCSGKTPWWERPNDNR